MPDTLSTTFLTGHNVVRIRLLHTQIKGPWFNIEKLPDDMCRKLLGITIWSRKAGVYLSNWDRSLYFTHQEWSERRVDYLETVIELNMSDRSHKRLCYPIDGNAEADYAKLVNDIRSGQLIDLDEYNAKS